MDEIELIRELRDGLPAPRAEARDAARASLMARIEPSMPKRRRPLRKRSKGEQMKTKIMVFAVAVVGAVAVLVVSAGAFDRTPVAPQLSAEEAGLKPGVVPGEVQEFNLPNGEKAYGEVSPCIQSDPSGYSNAELEDLEWCFHPPGQAGAKEEAGSSKEADAEPSEAGTYRMAHGKAYRLSNGGWVEVANSSGGG
jgi:hypothetical protein